MSNGMESMRLLVDMAIQCGRKRQNHQTGYLHYHYQAQDEDMHATIPLVENFLFALALLRSRTIENVNEAKVLLEGLLHFQNSIKTEIGMGNFPIYIHEYPVCKDRFTAVQIALAVYWILKLFHQVLGVELKRRLEDSFNSMLTHVLKAHTDKSASYSTAMKIGALCQAGGALLQRSDLESAGKNILDQLLARPDKKAWCCPASIGAMLSALTLLYPSLSESPWSSFWKHLEDTWHQEICCYMGPALKEWQDGGEPQVTLYDLFLGYFSGGFSTRALRDSIVHLEGVLIPPHEEKFRVLPYPQRVDRLCEEIVWHSRQEQHIAYCYIEKCLDLNPVFIKGFHPLRVVWGDHRRVHTLVCQGGNSRKIEFIQVPDGVDIIFELDAMAETEDREKNREIVFFVDIHDELEIFISGQKATTFSLGETLTLRSGMCQLSLVFQLLEGNGRFLGHRMLGNRPSQLSYKGKQRHDAHDWQLFLRTIKRSEPCVIKASLRIQSLSA